MTFFRRMKCLDCDVFTLVELTKDTTWHLSCPICSKDMESMGEVTVKEDEFQQLRQGVIRFVNKYFVGGGKAFREDYGTMVTAKDLYDLRALLKDVDS